MGISENYFEIPYCTYFNEKQQENGTSQGSYSSATVIIITLEYLFQQLIGKSPFEKQKHTEIQ